MQGWLEIRAGGERQSVALHADRVTIGSDAAADVVLDDPAVSALHLALDPVADRWTVRDLGSRNGTFLGGRRVVGEQLLADGDELRVGRTRLLLHLPAGRSRRMTAVLEAPPVLTPRERDVLLELCRPVLDGDAFTEPASSRQIADRLVVTESAVKQHLAHLYDKFDLPEGERRRVDLANRALRTGAISLGDISP